MAHKRNPGALAGVAGVGLTFNVARLNVTHPHSTIDGELHHALRLDRLRNRHGLKGSLAASIASLACDGGRR